jgi:hypothetical protein
MIPLSEARRGHPQSITATLALKGSSFLGVWGDVRTEGVTLFDSLEVERVSAAVMRHAELSIPIFSEAQE